MRRAHACGSAPARGSRAGRHSLALLLTDADTGAPVSLDYRKALSTRTDRRGNLTGVALRLPAGTALPAAGARLCDRRRIPAC